MGYVATFVLVPLQGPPRWHRFCSQIAPKWAPNTAMLMWPFSFGFSLGGLPRWQGSHSQLASMGYVATFGFLPTSGPARRQTLCLAIGYIGAFKTVALLTHLGDPQDGTDWLACVL